MNSKLTASFVLLLLLNALLIVHSQKESRRRTNRRRPTTESPVIEDTDYDLAQPQSGDSGSKVVETSDKPEGSAGSGSKRQEKSPDAEVSEEQENKETSTPGRAGFFAPRGTRRPRPTAVRGGNRPRPTLPSFIRNSSGRARKPAVEAPSEKEAAPIPTTTTTTTTAKPSRSRNQEQSSSTEAPNSRRKSFGQGRKSNSRGLRNSSV